MPNIAVLAINVSAETLTGKTPVNTGAAAKGDFRQHLAVVKAAANAATKAGAGTTNDSIEGTATEDTAALLASAPPDAPASSPAATPRQAEAANAGTAKGSKKATSAPAQTGKKDGKSGTAQVDGAAVPAATLPAAPQPAISPLAASPPAAPQASGPSPAASSQPAASSPAASRLASSRLTAVQPGAAQQKAPAAPQPQATKPAATQPAMPQPAAPRLAPQPAAATAATAHMPARTNPHGTTQTVKPAAQSDETAKQPDAMPQSGQAAVPAQTLPAASQNPPQTASIPATATAVTHPAASPPTSAKTSDITAQLANALPAGTAKADTGSTLHVSLKPETLGTITVKIAHSAKGDANVTITASQPETLETLKRNVDNLNQILTNAGVPEASRQLDFRSSPVQAAEPGAALGYSANSSMQNNSGFQQAPQHGTGFASSSSKNATPATMSFDTAASAVAAVPQNASVGSVNMIA